MKARWFNVSAASRRRVAKKRHAVGAAAIETVISMVVFVPLILAVPVLGKYMDIKQKALESSRYVAWERTVWSDGGQGWGDASVADKSSDSIVNEVDTRFYGHPLQGIQGTDGDSANRQQTRNPLWGTRRDNRDVRFLGNRASSNEGDQSQQVLRVELNSFVERPDYVAPGNLFVNPVADTGITTGIGALEQALGVIESIAVGDCELGVSLTRGLMLGTENRADVVLHTPINNVLGQRDLLLTTTAGILSNAWVVPNDAEDLYRARVGRITAAEPINCVVQPAVVLLTPLSLGRDRPIFGELFRTEEVRDTLSPSALPEGRTIN